MKYLLFTLLLSTQAYSQPNSNSQSRLPADEAEARAFEEWNRREEQARRREEETRRLNEERARGFEPVEKQEEVKVQCECPPPSGPQQ